MLLKTLSKRHLLILIIVLPLLCYGFHLFIIHKVKEHLQTPNQLSFDEVGLAPEHTANAPQNPPKVTELAITPMREAELFDADAQSWSTPFGLYHSGMVIFDANSDGRPDVYFCQDGQNWTRATDSDGVLENEPRHQHNGLYLNLGNDETGTPKYQEVKHLAQTNDTFVQEELLVENYLYPRTSLQDDPIRPGRQSITAVAADFNGDGLIDLLVGNGLPGSWWSHPETQRVLPRYVSPVGRESRHNKQPLAGLATYLTDYTAADETNRQRDSSRGQEYYGANSLFINKGDQDGDSIPEWEDVSKSANIEGKRNTFGFSVCDIDLDGDLDIFEANAMDYDFWPGGAQAWAGAKNQLYINQLSETGEFKFIERSEEMAIDGAFTQSNPQPHYYKLRKIPFVPEVYSLSLFKVVPFFPRLLTINDDTAEPAQISWAATWQDVNRDGYPDLWVANDFTHLELYINQEGKSFRKTNHVRDNTLGNWMGLTTSDFNGDLKEDMFAINSGSAAFLNTFIEPDPFTMFQPTISDSAFMSYFTHGYFDTRHTLISGENPESLSETKVYHSSILPPDAFFSDNLRKTSIGIEDPLNFDRQSFDPFEFAWGTVNFDLQNDGRSDLYFVGNMVGRAGGLFSFGTTGPGRLLINLTESPELTEFADLTVEHHVLNIEELQYDRIKSHGYVYRKAPKQNWNKRDMVYSYERSVWSSAGGGIHERILNQDLLQASENAITAASADLNQDGFVDLIVRNEGGYDSRSSKAKNLRYRKPNGSTAVLPPPDHNYPILTNFEPGRVRTFLNQYQTNHWIKLKLVDNTPSNYNRQAIGARVVVNEKYLYYMRVSQGSHVSNVNSEINIGMGKELLKTVTVTWPDKNQSTTTHSFPNLKNQTITLEKNNESSAGTKTARIAGKRN